MLDVISEKATFVKYVIFKGEKAVTGNAKFLKLVREKKVDRLTQKV